MTSGARVAQKSGDPSPGRSSREASAPPTTATASAGTNPESRPSGWETTSPPVRTFTAANGANSDAAVVLGVLDNAYGPVLQALGIAVAGASVAGPAVDCGAVALVQ
jgi:hypothetical protein